MRIYELALVISPQFSESQIKEVINKISSLLKEEKGKLTKENIWPKKALAYPINKQKEAQFVFLDFEAPNVSKNFHQKVRLTDGVLRYLLLRKSKFE